ncbi:hypothetical protein VTK56DRAFT_8228 [Thermocarpiscus australiensis]
MQAIGIGVVEIPVKLRPKRSGPDAHGKLRLHNVLHIPTSVCNIVGGPSTGDYHDVSLAPMTGGSAGKLTDQSGRRLACFIFNECRLWALRLSGPPVGPVVGPSRMDPSACYMIHALWPDSDRRRWAAAQPALPGSMTAAAVPRQNVLTDAVVAGRTETQEEEARARDAQAKKTQAEAAKSAGSRPYTAEEKAWLKRNFGDEFKFLLQHGLSIYKEEDREEGRAIARALMEEDDDDEDDDEDEDEDEEFNPEGHFADYHFTDEELDFIENGWGNSEMFMLSYGLKFYKDEDCEEAKAIVRALMADSDEGDDDEDDDEEAY